MLLNRHPVARLETELAAARHRIAALEQELESARAARAGHRDAIDGLAKALLERDRYTGEHSQCLVELAGGVAGKLGLDEPVIERIRAAALLHDIGKIAIPDRILHGTEALSEDGWAFMREHPVIGERILRAISGMGDVARIVRHEHERFDGTGYPDGLAGEEIPIGSRIILACDAYHAMTPDRPYRTAMTHREAIEEIARCAGMQFDPRVSALVIESLDPVGAPGERAARDGGPAAVRPASLV